MGLRYDRSNNESCHLTERVFPMVPHHSGQFIVPRGGLRGLCPVCGSLALFDGFTENERESGRCSQCGSINRQRQIAIIIRGIYDLNDAGSIKFDRNFSVFNAESTGALHSELRKNKNYVFSEYFGSKFKSGEFVGDTRHEDLRSLSFGDSSLDLVLSSDVLEHVPRPYEAHRDIFRVLKPGGRHVFTVPFYPWEALDEKRAVERDDGKIEYFGEKLYHGDPVRPGEGVLVWTIFGLEMIVELARIGFIVSYWNLHDPSKGIIGPWSIVFDARKPS
ncbi:MAG: methyltransferase domain-containing protein [Sphingomicrobium sp.]